LLPKKSNRDEVAKAAAERCLLEKFLGLQQGMAAEVLDKNVPERKLRAKRKWRLI